MIPVLINIGPIKIYTFGVFLTLSFFWGSFFLWKLIRLTSYKEEEIFDGVFLSLVGGLFFGRLVFVLLNFKDFGYDVLKFILINGYPGLSIIGLLFGSFFILYLYLSSVKLRFLEAVDYFIPPIYAALGFGKLGSFFSGTEAGSKTKFILAVKYFGLDGLRHLTPFYEALIFFFGVYIAYRLLFEIRKEKHSHGINGLFFIWYFGLVYLLFDKIKYTRLYLGGVSFNFLASLILVLTGSFCFLYYFRRNLSKRLSSITHLIIGHGKKINSRVHQAVAKKTGTGHKKSASSDR